MFNCLCINDLFALQRYKNFWTFLLFSLCFKALSTIYMQVGNFSTIIAYDKDRTYQALSRQGWFLCHQPLQYYLHHTGAQCRGA
jgi:hypothetical protein